MTKKVIELNPGRADPKAGNVPFLDFSKFSLIALH